MRTASILLALVVVLGFVSEANALGRWISCNRVIEINEERYGFIDWALSDDGREGYTMMYAGPIGRCSVPFSANVGLLGIVLIVVGMLALVTAGTFRWQRKRAA